ncbi:MAG: hypothetical protein U0359_17835 [Byssovorax sp.]
MTKNTRLSRAHSSSSSALRRALVGLGLGSLALFAGRGAEAQTKEELAQARALFQEAVALSAANNCSAALTKYRQVAKVKLTPQVSFNIAECEERLGKLVSALGNYRIAASQAASDPKAKDVAVRVAERIEDLEARIPKLTVKRGKGADTALIELDGSELGAAKLSSDIPLDPGAHVIVAKMHDKEYLHETIKLAEKETKTYEVKLNLAPVVVTQDVIPPPTATIEQPPPPPPKKSRLPGVIVLGGGGALAVTGIALIGAGMGKVGELNTACGGDKSCPPSAKTIADSGRTLTGAGEVLMFSGIAAAAVGTYLFIASGTPSKPAKTGSAVSFEPGAPGASIGGASGVGRF